MVNIISNKVLLHVESLGILVLTIYFYFQFQFSWLLFFLLLFAPDLAALGYLKDNKFGAFLYNLFHTYTIPIILIIISLLIDHQTSLMIAFIWVAHIGMDRLFGYGLKYPTNFKDNHLHRV